MAYMESTLPIKVWAILVQIEGERVIFLALYIWTMSIWIYTEIGVCFSHPNFKFFFSYSTGVAVVFGQFSFAI
jgi:hypothetical protein